jgi:serine/threonine-protein kinase RsbW
VVDQLLSAPSPSSTSDDDVSTDPATALTAHPGLVCCCASTPPVARARPVRSLHVARAAGADAIPALRDLSRRWSRDSTLDPDTVEDLVLAVDEAVTNVVDHAYPARTGAVRLHLARLDCGEHSVTVDDDGAWRPPPGDPGFRGRGLRLIDGLADHVVVTHATGGTTVIMSWGAHRSSTT